MNELTLGNPEALRIAMDALKQYANKNNWGETVAFGVRKQNRWLGEGENVDLAEEAIRQIKMLEG